MTFNRYAKRVDANQAQIISALESAHALVEVIDRPVDLLVGFAGRFMLMEVKNPNSRYGKAGLNQGQKRFFEQWEGYPLAQVDSPEAALRALNILKAAP